MTEEERIPLKEPIFKELQAEDPDVAPTEVESMCVNCGENVSHLTGEKFLILVPKSHQI